MINISAYHSNLKIIHAIVSIAFLLQCAGMFIQICSGSAMQTMFFMQFEIESTEARRLELLFGFINLWLGILVFIRPKRSLLILITVMMVTYSLIIQSQGGSPFSTWAVWAHMARIVTPICILLFLSRSVAYKAWGYYIMLVGLAITYFTHGLEALHSHPHFMDYIIRSSENIFSWKINQFTAEWILNCIGVLDLIVAIVAVVWRKKEVFMWMFFWGMLTGFARITSLGLVMYPEVMIRAIHIGAPVILIILTQNVPVKVKIPNWTLAVNKIKIPMAYLKLWYR